MNAITRFFEHPHRIVWDYLIGVGLFILMALVAELCSRWCKRREERKKLKEMAGWFESDRR